MTRATLIPPPPGSRRCDWPRSLATGKILSTAVERSTAGFGVIVTISVMRWLNPRAIRVVDPNVLAIPGRLELPAYRSGNRFPYEGVIVKTAVPCGFLVLMAAGGPGFTLPVPRTARERIVR